MKKWQTLPKVSSYCVGSRAFNQNMQFNTVLEKSPYKRLQQGHLVPLLTKSQARKLGVYAVMENGKRYL